MNFSIRNVRSGRTSSRIQLRGKFARQDDVTEYRNRSVLFYLESETLANKDLLNPG